MQLLSWNNIRSSRSLSIVFVVVCYVVAIGTGVLVCSWFGRDHPILSLAVADLSATAIIFICSFASNNSSIYDPFWSVVPICICFYWLIDLDGNLVRQLLIFILVCFWGVRLTLNWVRSWRGLDHQDWRYSQLQTKYGNIYWLISFSGIHLLPTILVFGAILPVYYSMGNPSPLGPLDFVAALVTLGAILIEFVADEQKWSFRKNPGSEKKIIDSGLWALSRHPNYFGEILFWVGLFLFVPASGSGEIWTIIGSLAMILLFVFISIPMMERRLMYVKPGYSSYQKRVCLLIPWIPKKTNFRTK